MITLTRFERSSTHTAGTLVVNGQQFFTIEREWNNNKVGSSCVPVGIYRVRAYNSPRFGPSWILSNHELGIGEFPGQSKRSGILIHRANFSFELQGCIAPGMSYGVLRHKQKTYPAVHRSREAIQNLLKLLPQQFDMEIK